MKHVESGLVSSVERPFGAHPTKGPYADPSIRVAAPGTSPVLQLYYLITCLTDKSLNHILVGQKVTSLDRIIGMEIQVVIIAHYSRGPTFGGYRMASHGIYLGYNANIHAFIGFGCSNGSTQSRATSSDEQDIVCRNVHKLLYDELLLCKS